MNRISRITRRLSGRVGLGYFGTLISLLVILLSIFAGSGTLSQMTVRIAQQDLPTLSLHRELLLESDYMRRAEDNYLDRPWERDKWLTRFDAYAASSADLLAQLERYATTADKQQRLAGLKNVFSSYLANDDRIRALLAAGELNQARRLREVNQENYGWELRQGIDTISALEIAQLEASHARGSHLVWSIAVFSMGVTLFAALFAGTMWVRTTKLINAPLGALFDGMRELSNERFTEVAHPAAAKTCELAVLQDGFNRMGRRLEESGLRLQQANSDLELKVRDRTCQLQAAKQELEATVEELRSLDRMKSNFMAIMSHELLTPIAFVVGHGSLLEDEVVGPLNPQQRKTVGHMMEGADRLTRMVRNTLIYTDAVSGTLSMAVEPVDYAAVVRDVVGEYQPKLARKGQTLRVDLPGELPPAFADPDHTRRCLAELLDNAWKFTPPGGSLSVSVVASGGELRTIVADDGPGIAQERLPSLLKPFNQADFSKTRQHGGMGLGLTIAYHLVSKMGGMMRIDSRPGGGAEVQFSLPRHKRDQRPASGTALSTTAPQGFSKKA